MTQSHLEAAFEAWLNQHPEIPAPEAEYRFHPTRQYRLDFAWPEYKVAVEIDGMGPAGAHRTRGAAIAEYEKYEAALVEGWTVYRVPGSWVASGDRYVWRPQVMETLALLIRRGRRCGD